MSTVTDRFNELEGTFEVDLLTKHFFSDGLYAKQMSLPKGYEAISHAHNYNHLSLLQAGRVILRTDDSEVEYTAPAMLEIKAGVHHSITALENVLWYCIHATDATDSSEVDEVLIKKESVCRGE
jgi:quercetin dioxygenase-like cupin family protein